MGLQIVPQLYFCEPEIAGRDKYLGGDIDEATGSIYCVPGSALRVLKVMPVGDAACVAYIGLSDLPGKFKWLRSCKAYDSRTQTHQIYGIPSCASSVLRIDPSRDHVSTFGDLGHEKWKWHGGVTAQIDGNIYAIPCNHPQVLKIIPATDEVIFLGRPDGTRQKWYGGIEAENGCIYGIPNCSDRVLKIDPASGEVSTFGVLSQAPYKWHGGVRGLDGCIYAIPSHADRVLRIDPRTDTAELMGDSILPGMYRPQGKYKYGGAVVGVNGSIYCFPSDADQVLKIDPMAERVYAIGPRFYHHNKWQNGYLASDDCIYAIPCNMPSVLQIDCTNDHVTTLRLPDAYKQGFDKWEGGVVDPRGCLWCMPQNSKRVMKIEPRSRL
ncbi:MAG: hypothetical protein P8144_06050 [Gammaproteobacteria bacterium]